MVKVLASPLPSPSVISLRFSLSIVDSSPAAYASVLGDGSGATSIAAVEGATRKEMSALGEARGTNRCMGANYKLLHMFDVRNRQTR